MTTRQLIMGDASELMTRLASYQMLPQLRREIIIDEAISSITCTPEEQVSACERFYAQNQLTDETSLQAWCQRYEMTREQLEALAVRQFKITKFKKNTWGNQLQSYFLKRKNQLDQVSYSLIRTKERGLTQELYFRILEGEQSFAELARKYSQGPEAQTNGLLGPITLGNAHPVIARKLFASQPGQLSSPIHIEEWFVIVRLEKLIPAQLDASMRRRLLNELFESWLAKQLNQLTAVAS